MKDTNAIEKALKKKIELEIKEVVTEIVTKIDAKFRQKYNAVSFYDFNKPGVEDYSSNFHVQAHELTKVLCNMLEKGHGEAMLSRKTKELLNKLEIM
tara:strand:- start:120 stop:410 length:291 start_codon:yes stop_codon:yes gene_type:complete